MLFFPLWDKYTEDEKYRKNKSKKTSCCRCKFSSKIAININDINIYLSHALTGLKKTVTKSCFKVLKSRMQPNLGNLVACKSLLACKSFSTHCKLKQQKKTKEVCVFFNLITLCCNCCRIASDNGNSLFQCLKLSDAKDVQEWLAFKILRAQSKLWSVGFVIVKRFGQAPWN